MDSHPYLIQSLVAASFAVVEIFFVETLWKKKKFGIGIFLNEFLCRLIGGAINFWWFGVLKTISNKHAFSAALIKVLCCELFYGAVCFLFAFAIFACFGLNAIQAIRGVLAGGAYFDLQLFNIKFYWPSQFLMFYWNIPLQYQILFDAVSETLVRIIFYEEFQQLSENYQVHSNQAFWTRRSQKLKLSIKSRGRILKYVLWQKISVPTFE